MDFLKNVKPTALVTLFLFVFFINVQAQEAIATSGIEATSTSGLVSATLGQVCYIQSSSVNGSKSQGVQQAFPVKSSSMLEIDKINLSAFPNPTQNLINLDYPVSKPVSFQIVNVTGKELMNGRLFRSKKIDLSSFSKGVYFIRIQDPNNSVQTIKIMKSIITFFAIVVFVANTFAQAPSAFSYQAVIRNSTGNLIQNQTVGVRLSILQGSGTGTVIYSESQTPSTNINGLISLELGSGSVLSGSFSNINWSSGSYFVKTETDPSGGTSYSISGTSQLLSVPYALYSNKAGETIKEDVIIVIDTSNYLTIANVDDDRIVNIQGELLLTTNFQKLRNDRVTVMGGEVTGDLTYPEVQIGENIIENVKFSYVELDDDSETTYINCEFDYVKFGSGRFVNCIIDNCTSTSVHEITSFSDCELNNCTFIRVDEIVNCEVDNSTIGNASYGTNYCKGNQIDDCSIYLDNIFASNDCDDSRVICLAGRDISIDGNTFDDPLSTSVDEIILINISSTRGNFNISNNFFEGQSSLEQFIKISVASSGTYKSMIMMSGNSFYYAERAITHNSSSVFISCNNNMYSRLSLGFGIVNGTNRNVRDNDSY